MDTLRFAKDTVVRTSIIALDLKRHPKFDTLTNEQFAAIYNGIGPDKWPEKLRTVMTALYDGLEELPGVHDIDFYFSDGTPLSFQDTLDRWEQNGQTLIKVRFPLWQVWRYRQRARAWAKIHVAYIALEKFSWPVYVEAAKRMGQK